MDRRNRLGLIPPRLALEPTSELTREGTSLRGRKLKPGTANRRVRSLSVDECRESKHKDCTDGVLPSGVAPVDMFIISRLNDSSSYFFTWFCKRYRIRIGVRDLGGKEEIQRCPICLDPCTKSIELQCGHAFCRSCLTTSAANNITSCALCRREQVINPELLRARFDEQRMLNLAQRLAIPPPLRSRPSTSGTTMSAGGNHEGKDGQSNLCAQNLGHEEKDLQGGGAAVASRPLNVESMTTRGQMLFGPWGDVGAMSTEDLRRRWEFSGMETSNAPDAATVGAASAAELRSSWRDLQHLSRAFTYMRGGRDVLGTPRQVSRDTQAGADVSSCSSEAEPQGNEIGPDSPCAGGSSLVELSSRWRTLARFSSEECSTGNDGSDDISIGDQSSSTKNASVHRKRIAELQIPPGQVSVDASSAPIGSSPVLDDDVGSLVGNCLKSRWLDTFKRGERDVGATEVKALANRFSLVRGAQGVGGVSIADLASRWTAAQSKESVGTAKVTALADRFSLARGAQGVGDIPIAALTSRWTATWSDETVGATEVPALAASLSLVSGAQGVGGVSIAGLTSRWTANQSKETVGAMEVTALANRLSLASGAQGAGAIPIADLKSRWISTQSKETVGATEVTALSNRLSLARGAQGVGDMSDADLTSRWTSTRSKHTVGATKVTALAGRFLLASGAKDVGALPIADLACHWNGARSKETVGATKVTALVDRFSLARGAQDVGGMPHSDLTRRWIATQSKETVRAAEARALAARLSVARGFQGVGALSLADLSSRWIVTRSKETVGATKVRALAARMSLARGAQGVGATSNTDLASRWTAAQLKEPVGLTEVGALAARFPIASGAEEVGAISHTNLRSRWTATQSKETVGATEVRALADRFSLASGSQGVGAMSNADLTSRLTAARSKETVGATGVKLLTARLTLARGAQGVGDVPNAGLTSRWAAARLKEADLRHAERCRVRVEEGRGSSSHFEGPTTHVPGWCIVDTIATSWDEVGKTCTEGERAGGAVGTSSALCNLWHIAGDAAAPVG